MAIEKRFIHFKKFSDFNSKKLSANEANTQYTVGISGAIQTGSPDVLYQSYVWIKDTQQQWTHGQIYNGSDVDTVFNQADWNESDETSSAYVKNRTHYASFNRIEIPETISSTTWTYIDIPDIVGYPIYVKYTFSGTVKSATLTMDDQGVEKEFNSGPQFVITRTPSSIGVKGNYDEGHILEISTNVAQLPEFFIPDSIARISNIPSEVYITDFDAVSLESLAHNDMPSLELDKQGLMNALAAHKVILVPYEISDNTSVKGYYTLVGYYEDLLYVKVITEYSEIIIETPLDKRYISSEEVTKRRWSDKQDTLKSGENVKTINGNSILGSGNITIEGGGGTITDVMVNGTSVATSGVASIPAASTSKYGVTKLTSSTSSTSTTLAATASAVKAAYDLAKSFVPMTLNTSPTSFGASLRWSPNQKYASTAVLANNVTFNIDVSSIDTTKDNTWALSFILGTSARTISFSVSQTGYTIMWANGVAPTFEPNTAYEITFKLVGTNLFGVCGAFKTV